MQCYIEILLDKRIFLKQNRNSDSGNTILIEHFISTNIFSQIFFTNTHEESIDIKKNYLLKNIQVINNDIMLLNQNKKKYIYIFLLLNLG